LVQTVPLAEVLLYQACCLAFMALPLLTFVEAPPQWLVAHLRVLQLTAELAAGLALRPAAALEALLERLAPSEVPFQYVLTL
jgi:hypothetical protein